MTRIYSLMDRNLMRPNFANLIWGVSLVAVAFLCGVAGVILPWWWVAIPIIGALALLVFGASGGLSSPHGRNSLFKPVARPMLAIELVALPLVMSMRQKLSVTLVLILLLLLVSVLRRRQFAERLNLVPTFLLLTCVALVCWRAVLSDGEQSWRLLSIAALYALAATILILTAMAVSRATAYASLLAGLSLYLVANVVGWLAGVKSTSSSVRIGGYESSGAMFGGSRVFFPFARAINEPSFVAVALIVAVAAMFSMRELPRWYHWAGIIAGLLIILASNSRMPVILAVPTIFFVLVAPRVTRAVAPYVVGVAMVLPFLLTQVAPVVTWVARFIASNSYLARGQNVDQIVGLGTREIIWTRSVDFWTADVTDTADQLIGFGYNGHASSGALSTYSSGIGDFLSDRAALTTHNSVLQTLYDAGLLGAVILLGVTVFTVYRYGRDASLLPMFSVAVMLGLGAITEIGLAPGLSQTPIFLLLYLVVFVPLKSTCVRVVEPDNRAHDVIPTSSKLA